MLNQKFAEEMLAVVFQAPSRAEGIWAVRCRLFKSSEQDYLYYELYASSSA